MDKTDYEIIKDYYDRLEGLKESGEIVNVYGGFEADAEVLGDFAEFFYVYYKERMPDWVNAYMQLHAWQFQRYHEGVDTYYENLYENTDYGSILRAAEYWAVTGHKELAEKLKAPAYEGAEEDSYPCPIKDHGKLIAETEEWIDDNEECIFDCYLEILLDNKNSLLAALKEE